SDPTSVAVGDFNADGKLDLGVTSNVYVPGTPGSWGYYGYYPGTPGYYNGQANVLLGTGTGSFAAPIASYLGYGYLKSVALADFNGDGKIDLVTANGDTGTVSVLLGSGSGAFKPPLSAAAGSSPLGVTAGDFNGDGRPDAASVNANSSNVSVLLNDGTWPALDAPSITINDVTVTEGNIGTTAATFTVS